MWSSDSATVTIGADDNVFPTLTNTDNVEVTYTSSATGVATINSEGTVTLVDAGETTISAAFAGDDEYNAKTVSYTLTVTQGITRQLDTWESDLAGYDRFLNAANLGQPTLASSDADLANYLPDIVVTVDGTDYTFDAQNVDGSYYWDNLETKTVAIKYNPDAAFPDIYVKDSLSATTVIEAYYGNDYIIYSVLFEGDFNATVMTEPALHKAGDNAVYLPHENVDLYNNYDITVVDENSNTVALIAPTAESNQIEFIMPAADVTVTITAKNQ